MLTGGLLRRLCEAHLTTLPQERHRNTFWKISLCWQKRRTATSLNPLYADRISAKAGYTGKLMKKLAKLLVIAAAGLSPHSVFAPTTEPGSMGFVTLGPAGAKAAPATRQSIRRT